MSAILSGALHPALLLLTVGAMSACAWANIPYELAIALCGAATMIIVAIGERLWPYERGWRPAAGAFRADALWALLSLGVTQVVISIAALAAARYASATIWPTKLPLAIQVVLYLALVELLAYWAHRALHTSHTLWPIHRLHHDPSGLYWLNGFRLHPLDAGIMTLSTLTWALFSGVPEEVVALGAAITLTHLLVQHSNIALKSAWMMPLLATAEFHRWHHLAHEDPLARQVNYGHVFGFWDVLFGSWKAGAPEVGAPMGLGDEQAGE